MLERRQNRTKREQFEKLRQELLQRLERVCSDVPREQLAVLTSIMTRTRMKYEPFAAVHDAP